ncbi:MAG: hypothetical protein KF851_13350 [Pirellulaceae bacterium]|nr:hypothetical protein [Pirellulaceae bacterium]
MIGFAVVGEVNGELCAVGIHNYGGCPNKATRITPIIKADLDRWLQESNE